MFSTANAQQYNRNKSHSPRPERPEQATGPHQNFTASLPNKGGKQCRLAESRPVETILAEDARHFFRRKAATIFFAFWK
jgi:alpha/beta superfamily hydrolase